MLDEQQVRQNWQTRKFSFAIWQDPPGQIWSDFTHETDELFMLVEGDVELIIDNKLIKPQIGEEILIPAQQMHTVKNVGNSVSRWYYGYKK